MSAAPLPIALGENEKVTRLRALAHRIETARSAIRQLSPHEASQLPAFDPQQTEAHGLRLAQWFEARAAELEAEAAAARQTPQSPDELNERNLRAELAWRLSAARGSAPTSKM